jgi:hypothetical protein
VVDLDRELESILFMFQDGHIAVCLAEFRRRPRQESLGPSRVDSPTLPLEPTTQCLSRIEPRAGKGGEGKGEKGGRRLTNLVSDLSNLRRSSATSASS